MSAPVSLPSPWIEQSVEAVEKILNYTLAYRKLLEEALTLSSCDNYPSYQLLDFVRDTSLSLAAATHVFLAYPSLDPGQLSLLRSANVSTEKLAEVAVRNRLYPFLRCNATPDAKASPDLFPGQVILATEMTIIVS
ncbi:hypothetical protein MLD38_034243 [Melastoma candidum]|uniref:Uncharacterized protein n=1 Tax=Melastoma candidum TaxID=119954 RepID=A0ACB9M9A7_9MYRT|nr:hypothetical protein MLD38_034243 [Melastoma candidum]